MRNEIKLHCAGSKFELYEDGKKQQLQFIEFVDVPAGRRSRDSRNPQATPAEAHTTIAPSDTSFKHVVAFVIDDLTIPANEMVTVRRMLSDFEDKQMAEGDLVAIVRSVGGRGLLEQLTADRDHLRRAISTLTSTSHPSRCSIIRRRRRLTPYRLKPVTQLRPRILT